MIHSLPKYILHITTHHFQFLFVTKLSSEDGKLLVFAWFMIDSTFDAVSRKASESSGRSGKSSVI